MLEGRELDPSELSLGRGWNAATKTGHDVTRELLAGDLAGRVRRVAVVAASPEARAAAAAVLEGLGWNVVGDSEPGASAIVVVVEQALTPRQAFEAGLAIGAFGDAAIVVQLGHGDPPPELAHLAPLRLDADDGMQTEALAERLRLAAEKRV